MSGVESLPARPGSDEDVKNRGIGLLRSIMGNIASGSDGDKGKILADDDTMGQWLECLAMTMQMKKRIGEFLETDTDDSTVFPKLMDMIGKLEDDPSTVPHVVWNNQIHFVIPVSKDVNIGDYCKNLYKSFLLELVHTMLSPDGVRKFVTSQDDAANMINGILEDCAACACLAESAQKGRVSPDGYQTVVFFPPLHTLPENHEDDPNDENVQMPVLNYMTPRQNSYWETRYKGNLSPEQVKTMMHPAYLKYTMWKNNSYYIHRLNSNMGFAEINYRKNHLLLMFVDINDVWWG